MPWLFGVTFFNISFHAKATGKNKKPKQRNFTMIYRTSKILPYLPMAHGYNSIHFESTMLILDDVMETLGDPNTHIIGVEGSSDESKANLLQRVRRRGDGDNLFDVVFHAITERPNVRHIQAQIASQLGLMLNEKSEGKRAIELCTRMKNEHKILIICWDLQKRLDLGKVGITFGADHTGCKILLTSVSEEVLSNQMHT